jgi:hypothetical protein
MASAFFSPINTVSLPWLGRNFSDILDSILGCVLVRLSSRVFHRSRKFAISQVAFGLHSHCSLDVLNPGDLYFYILKNTTHPRGGGISADALWKEKCLMEGKYEKGKKKDGKCELK